MISNIINAVLFAVAIVGVVYFVYSKKRYKKPENIRVIDEAAQKTYDSVKNKDHSEEKALSFEEKVKLSWQFLTDLKKRIQKIFSKDEQFKIRELGAILINNGMRYEHNIEQEANIYLHTVSKSAKKTKKTRNL